MEKVNWVQFNRKLSDTTKESYFYDRRSTSTKVSSTSNQKTPKILKSRVLEILGKTQDEIKSNFDQLAGMSTELDCIESFKEKVLEAFTEEQIIELDLIPST